MARSLKILLHGVNYAPEAVGIGKYTTEMAEWLAARGHDARIVTAPPYYPAWRIAEGYAKSARGREMLNGVSVRRTPIYVPQRPSGVKRILHHVSWLAASAIPLLRTAQAHKPDVVFAIAPSLAGAPAALAAARLTGAKSWVHVQDFEVEMAKASGLVKAGAAIKAGLLIERILFNQFDVASSISPKMCALLNEKRRTADAVFEFRNWVDTDDIRPLQNVPSPYRAQWRIAKEEIVCLYSGAISNKQGLETVIDAARLLQNKPIRFVICGQGPGADAIRARAEGLNTVTFMTFQPAERLNALLNAADIHLLPQKADAADLVLPSKLTGMLASGRPVIAGAAPGTGLSAEVNGCGVSVPPGDATALAAAIETLARDENQRRRLGAAARRQACRVWDKKAILERFETQLLDLAAPR
ncbi:MAG: WcaI family glycosyltransferase [Pseudomonadota bacterium]